MLTSKHALTMGTQDLLMCWMRRLRKEFFLKKVAISILTWETGITGSLHHEIGKERKEYILKWKNSEFGFE